MRYWNGEMVRCDVGMVTCPCNHNDGYCCRGCFCSCCCCSCCSFLNKEGIQELMRHLKGSRLKRSKGPESLRSTLSENQSWTQMNLTAKDETVFNSQPSLFRFWKWKAWHRPGSGILEVPLWLFGTPGWTSPSLRKERIVEQRSDGPTSPRNPTPNEPSGLKFQVGDEIIWPDHVKDHFLKMESSPLCCFCVKVILHVNSKSAAKFFHQQRVPLHISFIKKLGSTMHQKARLWGFFQPSKHPLLQLEKQTNRTSSRLDPWKLPEVRAVVSALRFWG